MFWLGLRIALALFLVTRRRAGRVTMLFAGLLLPGPLRSIAELALLGKIAMRAARDTDMRERVRSATRGQRW